MDWAEKPHLIEVLAEWGAPIVLASAAGWSASMAGLPLAAEVPAVVIALSLGIIAMRKAGGKPSMPEAGFQPVEFGPGDYDNVLLLDDPLVEVEPDSRVVRLFARTDPTPGELVLRISDYLSEQSKPSALADRSDELEQGDASAALHAALANIRATLR